MESSTIKLSYYEFLVYHTTLLQLSEKSSPLSYTVSRNLIYTKSILTTYQESVKALIDIYGIIGENGEYVLINDKKPSIFTNLKLKDSIEGNKMFKELNEEEIEIKLYKPKSEIIIDYLKLNPPSCEYLSLNDILFDLDKINM